MSQFARIPAESHQSEKAFRRYTLRSQQEAAIAAYYRAIGEEAE